MNITPEIVMRNLEASIDTVLKCSRMFVKNPTSDFTRIRKLSLQKIVRIILTVGGNSLNKELLDFYNYNHEVVTTSAFVQQRNKLFSDLFGFLLSEFVDSFDNFDTYKGYRLLALDGTGCNIPKNPNHPGTYIKKKDLNELFVVALYDLCNKLYLDSEIQVVKKKNEFKALTHLVDRSSIATPVILLADRGLESYNNIEHLKKKGWKFLIRAKGPESKKSAFAAAKLPLDEEFDCDIGFELTRRQTKEVLNNKVKYRLLVNSSTFDYLPKGSKESYPMGFRAICIKDEYGRYQYFITNLDKESFSTTQIKELYKLRWGIETSFRELKHTLGVTRFHAKKVDLIKQEIYAGFVMYNYCALITLNVIITQKDRKHTYKVNFSIAIHICKQYFLRFYDPNPPNVKALIQKYILPVRENRVYPRKVKIRSRMSFLYRVA